MRAWTWLLGLLVLPGWVCAAGPSGEAPVSQGAVGSSATATSTGPASDGGEYLARSAKGVGIPHPTSRKTYPVKDGDRTVAVPENMVYVGGSDFTYGTGAAGKKVHLDGYCIGRFSVTNAEYKAFIEATGAKAAPSYWAGGRYPDGKGSHPVVEVSLTNARAYARWMSRATGWDVRIPTSEQWEKAARGPQGFLYPWGNSADVRYAEGKLSTKFNFNAVTVAEYLEKHPTQEAMYNNSRSMYFGKKTTVAQIAAYDAAGNATALSLSSTGMVKGWVNHETYTGFIYTDVFTALNKVGGNTTAVGSYEEGKSAYGCYDMAGNVWNWCDSEIVATNGAEKNQTVNEIRGGSWYATGTSCRSVSIGEGRQGSGAYNTVGFRVVMVPAAEKR